MILAAWEESNESPPPVDSFNRYVVRVLIKSPNHQLLAIWFSLIKAKRHTESAVTKTKGSGQSDMKVGFADVT